MGITRLGLDNKKYKLIRIEWRLDGYLVYLPETHIYSMVTTFKHLQQHYTF